MEKHPLLKEVQDNILLNRYYNEFGTSLYIYYDYLINENLQKIISPVYKTMPGWQSSTFGITEWSDLPENAQNYINYIEEVIETKISIISTGPERSQTIDRNNILSKI